MGREQEKMIIIELSQEESVRATLRFIKHARCLHNLLRGKITINYSEIMVYFNLLMFELSLKALTSYHLQKYERTHFFLEDTLIKDLSKVINVSPDVSNSITEYKKIAQSYMGPSKYGELEIIYSDENFKLIKNISNTMFNFMWINLQKTIKPNYLKL